MKRNTPLDPDYDKYSDELEEHNSHKYYRANGRLHHLKDEDLEYVLDRIERARDMNKELRGG